MADLEIPLRIVLTAPPPNVLFAIQEKRDPVDQTQSAGSDIAFDLTVRARRDPITGSVRFGGPYAQGPSAARFVYVCIGTYAGDPRSCWSRRAKVPLSGLDWALIERAAADPGAVLEARIPGAGRDGSPVCASVRLLGDGWSLARAKGPAGRARGGR